jgi:hypothetical protein
MLQTVSISRAETVMVVVGWWGCETEQPERQAAAKIEFDKEGPERSSGSGKKGRNGGIHGATTHLAFAMAMHDATQADQTVLGVVVGPMRVCQVLLGD